MESASHHLFLSASLGSDSYGSPTVWGKPPCTGKKELEEGLNREENGNILSEIQKSICIHEKQDTIKMIT